MALDMSLLDSIVFVHVGPQKKVFGVHKGLICHHSAYFKGALQGEFKEAIDGVVVLADDKPEIFSYFYSWLYTGEIKRTGGTLRYSLFEDLLDLYIFAQKRIIPDLQNGAIDRLVPLRPHPFTGSPSRIYRPLFRAWSQLSETTTGRGFTIDYLVANLGMGNRLVAEMPHDLLAAVAKDLQDSHPYKQIDARKLMNDDRCSRYHKQ